ncbi:MAG: OB-fold nucleic acid binding domain-containing protein, partial [Treponema sp.]|nr:OB-fold nucleic acid binding domain-containing protein [Treponema sp.]
RRENLLGNLDRAVDYVQNMKEDKKFGQASLFEDSGESEYPEFEFEDSPEIGRAEKLTKEKELIGFYFSGHPLDEYKNLWQKFVKADLGQRETWIETGKNTGSQILIGMIKNIKVITTSRGDKMAFASLEDYNGDIELTFFSGPWGRYNSKIEDDKVAILKGRIDYQRDKDKYSFIVEDYLEPNELDKTVREDEAEERRWDKYRNVWKYANGIGIRILDLKNPADALRRGSSEQRFPSGAESGSYTLIGAVKSIRTHIDKKGKDGIRLSPKLQRGNRSVVFRPHLGKL